MSQSVIRRFEQRVLKDKSGSDSSQVPAEAQITIHRQGATLSESMSIPVVTPDPVPIEVYDVGELKAPDIVEVDADEDKQLLVEGVSADNKLLVTNISGVQLDLVVGDRLVPTTDLPEIFADPLGTVPSSNPFSTNPQTGHAGRYIRNRRFDYSVAGSDFPTRLYMDAEGGRPSSWINATEFSSIQAAIDAAEPGAVILIPSGLYSENLLINKKLTLQGDQIGENPFVATGQAGTVLTPTGPNNHAITIVSPAGLVQVRNLRIQGDDVPGSGDGIHIVGNSESERVSTVVIDSVFITAVGRHGVYCKEVDFPLLQNVHCVANKSGGM